MKAHAYLLFGVAVLFVAAQGINRPTTSPGSAAQIHQPSRMPGSVQAVVNRSCKDCHSAETAWPWYGRLAPVSWLIERDVREGRKRLDFTKWAAADSKGPTLGEAEEMCGAVSTGDMPPAPYRFMHPKARLTSEDVAVFCQWAEEFSKSASSR
jgi:mono/diheme cytochrome c family protein